MGKHVCITRNDPFKDAHRVDHELYRRMCEHFESYDMLPISEFLTDSRRNNKLFRNALMELNIRIVCVHFIGAPHCALYLISLLSPVQQAIWRTAIIS